MNRNILTKKPTAQARLQGFAGGFTIVEIMIVLAIAGLILLIMFEAIPALERNARNSNRKQDVTAILQAASHYELNHSANFPPSVASFLLPSQPQLYAYTTSQVTLHSQVSPAIAAQVGPVANTADVDLYNYERCDPANAGKAKDAGAGYSDVVALYAIESSGGMADQCQQL
jgi:prepilin-type N-terminal cleavage/methylation domain-containing protein